MLRVILCSLLVAVAAVAAPAPVYRASGVWVEGWAEPVDPLGDSRFDRDSKTLSVTVRGKKEGSGRGYLGRDLPYAARLLRDVDGDFSAQVRVGGDFHWVGE